MFVKHKYKNRGVNMNKDHLRHMQSYEHSNQLLKLRIEKELAKYLPLLRSYLTDAQANPASKSTSLAHFNEIPKNIRTLLDNAMIYLKLNHIPNLAPYTQNQRDILKQLIEANPKASGFYERKNNSADSPDYFSHKDAQNHLLYDARKELGTPPTAVVITIPNIGEFRCPLNETSLPTLSYDVHILESILHVAPLAYESSRVVQATNSKSVQLLFTVNTNGIDFVAARCSGINYNTCIIVYKDHVFAGDTLAELVHQVVHFLQTGEKAKTHITVRIE